MNHHLLCAMGVGHRVFDTVCQVGGECGFPSKLTGAGGGGCAFCLIVPGWCTVCVPVSHACMHVLCMITVMVKCGMAFVVCK